MTCGSSPLREVPRLGERGGGWVVIQFALIAAIVVAGLAGPAWSESVSSGLSVAGALLAVAGAVLAAVSVRALGRSLTPFPRPSVRGEIVERGSYRFVRHPIYSGGILFFTGFSLFFSPAALILTATLAAVWGLKSRVEERFLLTSYPGYAAYCARTRSRLIPFVY